MIYTSYFARLKDIPDNAIPISICGRVPVGYKGIQYKKLAPKYDFFMEWKQNQDNDFYIRCFQEQVLDCLTPQAVLANLVNLVPEEFRFRLEMSGIPVWEHPDLHILLVCYEKPGDFCHRHLVAGWLTKNGIPCEEYDNIMEAS